MAEMIGIGLMVGIIVLASAVHKYLDGKNQTNIPSEAEERIMARLDELDRRITDIQDVMIALDDKMSRKN